MGKGTKGGGFGSWESGPPPDYDSPYFWGTDDRGRYRIRGIVQRLRMGEAIDVTMITVMTIGSIVCIVTLILPLTLAYVTAPHSQYSTTFYLQAGHPSGQTWLTQLPAAGLFTSTTTAFTQAFSAHAVMTYQFSQPPPLMVDSTLEIPIIPRLDITGGVTSSNWAWWGYELNQGATVWVNVSCIPSQPVHVCVDTTQDQFNQWQSMASVGESSLDRLNSQCTFYANRVLEWSKQFSMANTETMTVTLYSVDIGSWAWIAYNAGVSSNAPTLAPTAHCSLVIQMLEPLYNLSTALHIRPLQAGQSVELDASQGFYVVLQAPNISDSVNAYSDGDLQVEADQYTVRMLQNLSAYGQASLPLNPSSPWRVNMEKARKG